MSKKILEKNVMGADFARQSFVANPAPGTTLEEVMAIEYWTHVATKFKPHDIIEVIPQDGAYYARLIVVDCANLWARTKKLEYVDLVDVEGESSPAAREEYEIKWGGGSVKFRIHRKSNNELLAPDSFQDRASAEAFLANFLHEQAA